MGSLFRNDSYMDKYLYYILDSSLHCVLIFTNFEHFHARERRQKEIMENIMHISAREENVMELHDEDDSCI